LNGFIIDSIEAGVAAVRRLDGLDRKTVRADFEARFTARRMAKDYVAAYRLLLAGAAQELPELDEENSPRPPLLASELGAFSANREAVLTP
jgi:hypothetical protein